MTGVPSIVFGLFVYIVLVVGGGRRDVRRLEGLGRAGAADAAGRHALGRGRAACSCPTRCARRRWRSARRAGASIFRIVLPTALPGLVTGSLLAVARAAGETAPLLFTAAVVNGTTFDLGERMNSLPLQIFNDVGQAQDRLVERAWGAALTLVVLILLLTLVARLVPAKEPPRMTPDDPTADDRRSPTTMTDAEPQPTAAGAATARRDAAARRRRRPTRATRSRCASLNAYYGDDAGGQGRRPRLRRRTRSPR